MPQVPAAARGGIVDGGTEKQTPNVQKSFIGEERDGNLKSLRQFRGNPHPAFAAVQPHFDALAGAGILLPAGWHAVAPRRAAGARKSAKKSPAAQAVRGRMIRCQAGISCP